MTDEKRYYLTDSLSELENKILATLLFAEYFGCFTFRQLNERFHQGNKPCRPCKQLSNVCCMASFGCIRHSLLIAFLLFASVFSLIRICKLIYQTCTHIRDSLSNHIEPTWYNDVAFKFYVLESIY